MLEDACEAIRLLIRRKPWAEGLEAYIVDAYRWLRFTVAVGHFDAIAVNFLIRIRGGDQE
jgi:hypothetical protein